MQIEMTIKGLMVDPITNMPIVILRDKDGQKVLPIWVGIFEANAIALQIENVATPRPMTHDLLRNVIQDLKASVQKIVVCDLQDNTFYALIYLSLHGDTLAIDARPSDAIALALRTKAPIFVEESVIDNAKTMDPSSDRADADRLHNGSIVSIRTTSEIQDVVVERVRHEPFGECARASGLVRCTNLATHQLSTLQPHHSLLQSVSSIPGPPQLNDRRHRQPEGGRG